MRFRLGYATGFATGYYLGAKAGRQRYDQINRNLRKLRRSEAFETVTERARTVIDEGVEKAKNLVDRRSGEADPMTSVPPTPTPTTADGSSNGTNTIPAAAPLTGHGVQATQAGHGVQATQAGHGVQATQAGQPTIAPPPVEPPYSSSR